MLEQNNFPSLYPTGMPPSPPDTDVSDDDNMDNIPPLDGGAAITPQKSVDSEPIEGVPSVAASEPGLVSESIMSASPSIEDKNESIQDEKENNSVGNGSSSGRGGLMQNIIQELNREGVTLATSTAKWKGLSGSSSVVSSVTAGTRTEKSQTNIAPSTNSTTGSFLPSAGSSTSSSRVENSFDDSSSDGSHVPDEPWSDTRLPPSLVRNVMAGEIESNTETFRTTNRTYQQPNTALSVLAPSDGDSINSINHGQQQLPPSQRLPPQPQNAIPMVSSQTQQYQPAGTMMQQQVLGHATMPQEVQINTPQVAPSPSMHMIPNPLVMAPAPAVAAAPIMVPAPVMASASAMAPLQPQHLQQAPNMSLTYQPQLSDQQLTALSMAASAITERSAPASGRRAITLRLLEDVAASAAFNGGSKGSKLKSLFRRHSARGELRGGGGIRRSLSSDSLRNNNEPSDRGTITVSWYEGTTTVELQDHVRNSVSRKLKLKVGGSKQLKDIQLIDENVVPNEEVVITPYIPDGSHFLLKFTIKENANEEPKSSSNKRFNRQHSNTTSRPPDSPSAAPSPYPSSVDLVNMQQLQTMFNAALLQNSKQQKPARVLPILPSLNDPSEHNSLQGEHVKKMEQQALSKPETPKKEAEVDYDDDDGYDEDMSDPDELVKQRLQQLNEILLLQRRSGGAKKGKPSRRTQRRRQEEKKQVIFILANYFVLFLSLIAISAEIHERAPGWMKWVEAQMDHVQDCAADRDALFECVSNGDIAGLYASFLFWITRSVTTKRLLLFGFDSPKKLWTVVYEALVTAVCWGTSYLFIRRGMNPDTRDGFLHKYWKDAVYGSLAGFNAAFLKAILKNLIPQEVLEDALENRQLKIVHWIQGIF
mmetsp:Transcript_31316/g.45645  ORF Transcript_31316/g.45645 Transcript_31316/m.45645 type:complete len:875 (+) Transcript_31316:214-2838(+)